ncbi:MAG TPA: ABC transporter permease subunit, partial [Vicinamibacterales bacterium]|nr:ABC transporter permease subunit [Vicinamibacterales bacterium]
MTDAALRHSVRKEIHALFPTWAASMCAVAAANLYPQSFLASLAVLAYGLGSLALGAQAIGHEYTHRTLGLLLTQPASRRALLLVKCGVLAPMLLALGGVALIVFGAHGGHGTPPVDLQKVALVALSSLFVAPALTMFSRSAMAGMLFTGFPPGGLWLAASLIGIARFGSDADAQIDALARMFLWRGMLVIAAVAAVSSWVMFMRLEAIEGRGRDLHLPEWLFRRGRTAHAPAAMQKRHPVLQLIAKELHVQQLAFAVTGLFALGIGFVVVRRYLDPNVDMDLAVPIACVHFAILSM